MQLTIPNKFPIEKDDKVLEFNDQTFIQFHRKKECFKKAVALEQHLIMIILKGEKVMISADQDLRVRENEALFLEKGLYLTSEKFLKEEEFSSLLFFVKDDFLSEFKLKYSQYLPKDTICSDENKMFKIPYSPNLELYAQSLLPYFENDQKIAHPVLLLKIEELLLSLLFSDNGKQFNNYLSSIGMAFDKSFKATVEQSIFTNLTIEERAFLSNLSVSSFKRKFKEVFKDTPARWLRIERLKRAKFLIKSTDKNVSEIAYEVGFESTSHFIHIFKKQFGITPKQWSN